MDNKIRQYLSHIGRKGGTQRWQNTQMTKKERSEMMRRVRRGERLKNGEQVGSPESSSN